MDAYPRDCRTACVAKVEEASHSWAEGVLPLGWFLQTRWQLQAMETSGLLVTLNEENCHHTVCSRCM